MNQVKARRRVVLRDREMMQLSECGEEWWEEVNRVADLWHTWWRERGGTFSPPRPAACHEW
jgi:hypothetical protein